MAQTIGDLIRSAQRKIGVLAAGEPLPANEADDSLEVFRQMIDSWSLEQLLVPVRSVVTHELQSNVSEYTIGINPDGNPLTHIEAARPENILSAFIRDRYDTDYILEQIDVKTYSRISRKGNGSRPSRFYYREGWPVNTILFESVPYANETLHLEVIQPFREYLQAANLTEAVNLPPGYEKVLIYNLCLELAPEWGKDITPLIATQAVEGKKWLKRNNYQTVTLGMDRAVATQRKGIGTYLIEQGP